MRFKYLSFYRNTQPFYYFYQMNSNIAQHTSQELYINRQPNKFPLSNKASFKAMFYMKVMRVYVII